MWGRAQLTDAILNQGKRRTRLIFARVSSHLEQRFRPSKHASSSRSDTSQMRARGMQCCRSTSNKLEVSEATKLAICQSVPRHPASSTARPSVTWALLLDKVQVDTTARGSTDRLEHREPHGSNGLQLRGMEIGGGAVV